MERGERRGRGRKKKSGLRLYLAIVFSMVGIFLIGFFAVVWGSGKKTEPVAAPKETETVKELPKEDDKEEEPEEEKGERVTIAVFGLDKEELHTDVNFVVCFDTATKDINLLQVPRDTKVTMTEDMLINLRDRKKYIPVRDGVEGQCKLTEVHAYAGPDYANEFSVRQLEDLLGIEINYYVTVNISGFRDIVDAIGGVEMNVEEDLNYNDPFQDLRINLKAGLQTLDGDKAEQLVRFREGYVQKDLKRIQVQQDFMRAFMKKIMSTDTLLKNLPNLVYTAFKYVDTNVSIGDALKYVKYIKDISMDKVTMETIPGEGGSYFVMDEEGAKELVDRLLLGNGSPAGTAGDGDDEGVQTDSKELSIEVANGGEIQGLAGKTRDALVKEGYTISSISTYTGRKTEETRIIVKEAGIGKDLLEYFPNAVIEVDPTMISNGTDIKIILGLEAK